MTDLILSSAQRLAWLCNELAAGNSFSPEQYRRWAEEGREEMERLETRPKMQPKQTLYIRSMGKALKVTAIAQTDEEANVYMQRNLDEGVVAMEPGRIYLAALHDRGVNISE